MGSLFQNESAGEASIWHRSEANAMQKTAPLLLALIAMLPVALSGQTRSAAPDPAPIPMPGDRAADSYAIYSSLMPLGETANPDWAHDYWLVQDATVAVVPVDQPCKVEPGPQNTFDMNPNVGVHPTKDRQQDFKEILDDFDAHCHDRVALSATAWQTTVPVRLLTPAEQDEYRATIGTTSGANSEAAKKYKGAPALYGFSEVYFNVRHTVALVYATHWCGGLCGQGFWVAFALEDGQWKRLKWDATTWIS
jgi:hypothetical protein